jgi:drug/metabolite transporter (DMT)-like permease
MERLVGDSSQEARVARLSEGMRRACRSISHDVRPRGWTGMNQRSLSQLVLLALIWGSSFMFIKIAVRDLNPATLVLGRTGLAAVALGVVVLVSLGRGATAAELRAHWRGLLAVGLLNTAVPFWLLSWGETRIDSGLASIIQASVPIFNALLAYGFFHEQRVTRRRLAGVAIGFVGVALLVGAQPEAKILGVFAVVGMATCYAAGGLLAKQHLGEVRPQVVAFGTTAVAALAVTPAGIAFAPHRVPHWKTFAAVAVLGLVATAFAYLLFFTINAEAGAAYASLVTYLVPPIALAYGALFLDERVGVAALAGLALILGGVGLGTRAGKAALPATAPEPS